MGARLEPSELHRLFSIPLGRAPERCYSRHADDCDHSGLFGTIAAMPWALSLMGFIYGFGGFPMAFPLAIASLVVAVRLTALTAEFERRERFARARLRRHECRRCSRMLRTGAFTRCPECEH